MGGDRVVYIGLDACDPAVAQRFAAEGVMPHLARLLETSARAPVENAYGLFVGALWVSFGTALRAERHGFHCWDEIDPATYTYRLNTPDIGHLPQFWDAISAAGRRVAVIDVPHMIADRPLDGFQLCEWGCHDKHHGLHSWPPEKAGQLADEFGLHPALMGEGDPYAPRDFAPDDVIHREGDHRTREEECALTSGMIVGARAKRAMLGTVLEREAPDLMVAVYAEGHSTGHQQWHLHDARHPRHDAATVAAMGGDPLAQVYAELDRGLGDMMAALGDDALLLVHLSHGMGPHYDATHMLDEVLRRLEREAQGGVEVALRDHPVKRLARPFVPVLERMADAVRLPKAIRARLRKGLVTQAEEVRAGQRFFMEPNNTVYGGIRLNLVGREPQGRVTADEADAVIAELEAALLEIVNVETGKPIVRALERCDRWHRRSPGDTMPDLLIDWERSVPVSTVSSPRIGTLHMPDLQHRTGDHRPAGLLVAHGPGMRAGERMPALAVEDIGPSIAARLGVRLSDVDGRPAAWLAGEMVS